MEKITMYQTNSREVFATEKEARQHLENKAMEIVTKVAHRAVTAIKYEKMVLLLTESLPMLERAHRLLEESKEVITDDDDDDE